MYLPFTLRVAVETASPFLLVALHMYTPESSALICDMLRATYPKLNVVLILVPISK